ncbi:MAG TPA: STAS domain-containing protein [candidate division Zixibacteria bacterium]|nr:STAS domain-containing protein [candidate division Zixibacteria bacterium]
MPEELKISVESAGLENEVVKIRVDGVLDTLTSPELEKVMNSLVAQKRYKIIIDLGGVDYISSAGWGIFISHLKEIRENRGDLKLTRMLPQVSEIFELLEFDSILKTYPTLENARFDFIQDQEVELKISELNQDEKKTLIFKQPVSEEITVERTSNLPEDLNQKVRKIISSDPFLSIAEITREINSNKTNSQPVGFWKVFKILRKNKLLRKQNRFKLSWREKKT